jgi:predicted NAD/FAD-binding protein
VFSADSHVGGHTHTHSVHAFGRDYQIDTGFIVYNNWTYPHFIQLLDDLGVATQASQMSFSVRDEVSGLEYNGTSLNSLFAQRRNAFRPSFLLMIRDILRFNKEAPLMLNAAVADLPFADYLKKHRYSQAFIKHYIIPMGSAIWSVPLQQILEFPAESFLKFFKNHGLLTLFDRPSWQTVVGGSSAYLAKFRNCFNGQIKTDREVSKVKRNDNDIEIQFKNGASEEFSEVVFACHADQVLKILENPSDLEINLFKNWQYQENKVTLHSDDSIMPPKKCAWASWNYHSNNNEAAKLTYYMNKLQGLKTKKDYFVSLNSDIAEDKILRQFVYTHPVYNQAAVQTQNSWNMIQGIDKTYYCGSYWGEGFHEDAARSGVQVALMKGIAL